MRVVFMGTPAFAAAILDAVAEQHEVAAVFTRPDAVRGRGSRPEPSPVKEAALARGLPVMEPRTLRDESVQRTLADLAPDVVCVAAYGAILPKAVLDIPRFGCLNVHASLLPRWRGAAPIERAILAGDEEAGVCIMRMEEGLDTGAYCVRRTVRTESKGAAELTEELAVLGAQALLTALAHVEAGAVDWTEQDEEAVTYAAKIERGELDLDPAEGALAGERKVRASGAAHPSRAVVAERPVTVLAARAVEDAAGLDLASGIESGEVRFAGKRLFLGTAAGALEALSVKPDGKQAMDAKSFAAGVQGLKQNGSTWRSAHV